MATTPEPTESTETVESIPVPPVEAKDSATQPLGRGSGPDPDFVEDVHRHLKKDGKFESSSEGTVGAGKAGNVEGTDGTALANPAPGPAPAEPSPPPPPEGP